MPTQELKAALKEIHATLQGDLIEARIQSDAMDGIRMQLAAITDALLAMLDHLSDE